MNTPTGRQELDGQHKKGLRRLFALLASCIVLAPFARGDNFTDLSGFTYSNVTVQRYDAYSVTFVHSKGIVKVSFADMSATDRLKFGYSAEAESQADNRAFESKVQAVSNDLLNRRNALWQASSQVRDSLAERNVDTSSLDPVEEILKQMTRDQAWAQLRSPHVAARREAYNRLVLYLQKANAPYLTALAQLERIEQLEDEARRNAQRETEEKRILQERVERAEAASLAAQQLAEEALTSASAAHERTARLRRAAAAAQSDAEWRQTQQDWKIQEIEYKQQQADRAATLDAFGSPRRPSMGRW